MKKTGAQEAAVGAGFAPLTLLQRTGGMVGTVTRRVFKGDNIGNEVDEILTHIWHAETRCAFSAGRQHSSGNMKP